MSRDHAHAAEMWSSDSDPELTAAAATSSSSSSTSSATSGCASPPPAASLLRQRNRRRRRRKQSGANAVAVAVAVAPADETEPEPEPEAEDVWRGAQWEASWPARRAPRPVVLAGGDDAVGRSRSLTDDDLEELKGCADLGFGFSYDEIPELRATLPALELCYSMTQRLQLVDDVEKDKPPLQQQPAAAAQDAAAAPSPPPVTNWKISSPGDSPDEVKARLKYWAQAVACTVRLCS